MILKGYQNEALKLIQEIWKDDIKKGCFFYDGSDKFSECSFVPNDVEEWPKHNFEESYPFKYYKSIFFLERIGLIKDLKGNRMLGVHDNGLSWDQLNDSDIQDDDYAIDEYYDYQKYLALAKIIPKKRINDHYTFLVTDKCKNSDYDGFSEIITKESKIKTDLILGEYNKVVLKESGLITVGNIDACKITKGTKPYNLLKVLISQKTKNRIVTIPEILESLGISPDSDYSLLLPPKTYENLNATLLKYRIPIRVRKSGDGYMLEKKI